MFDVIGNREGSPCGLPIDRQDYVARLQTGARGRAVFEDGVDLRVSRLKWNSDLLSSALDRERERLVRIVSDVIGDAENFIKRLPVNRDDHVVMPQPGFCGGA